MDDPCECFEKKGRQTLTNLFDPMHWSGIIQPDSDDRGLFATIDRWPAFSLPNLLEKFSHFLYSIFYIHRRTPFGFIGGNKSQFAGIAGIF
jgi:hypothetical protein